MLWPTAASDDCGAGSTADAPSAQPQLPVDATDRSGLGLVSGTQCELRNKVIMRQFCVCVGLADVELPSSGGPSSDSETSSVASDM